MSRGAIGCHSERPQIAPAVPNEGSDICDTLIHFCTQMPRRAHRSPGGDHKPAGMSTFDGDFADVTIVVWPNRVIHAPKVRRFRRAPSPGVDKNQSGATPRLRKTDTSSRSGIISLGIGRAGIVQAKSDCWAAEHVNIAVQPQPIKAACRHHSCHKRASNSALAAAGYHTGLAHTRLPRPSAAPRPTPSSFRCRSAFDSRLV